MSNVEVLVVRERSKETRGRHAEHDKWLRRQACNVVTQMPDDPEDAIKVLRYALTLISAFWVGSTETD